jgi:hypothetical protein
MGKLGRWPESLMLAIGLLLPGLASASAAAPAADEPPDMPNFASKWPQVVAVFGAASVGSLANGGAVLLLPIQVDQALPALQEKYVEVVALAPDREPSKRTHPEFPYLPDFDILSGVVDRQPHRAPVQGNLDLTAENMPEYEAYKYLLAFSHRMPIAEMARHYRKDLTYVHLFEEPAKNRGQLVRVRGVLRMLDRYDPLRVLANDGVQDLYEAWVLDRDQGFQNFVCVLTTEKPPGIEIGKDLNKEVEVYGYFYKRWRYPTRDMGTNRRPVNRDVPMIMGKIQPYTEPAEAASGWFTTGSILPIVLALIGIPIVLAVVFAYWFRKGDQVVRDRVASARLDDLVLPSPNGESAPEKPAWQEETKSGSEPSAN